MTEQLPALHGSRLPWHPVFEEYGIARTDWQALVEAVFPGAQSLDSIRLALSYCKRRNLDPFKRVIHIVPIWDSTHRKYVDTIWPGIAELRTTAFRTQQYAGADAAQFGDVTEHTWQDGDKSVTITYPAWAQLTVYRLVGGQRVPVPGPRVYWMETYSAKGRSDVPNERWQRAPNQMLEKCAEAAALRRAFPEELGDQHVEDEVGALTRDVTPPPEDEPSPAAASLRGNEALRSRLERAKEPAAAEVAEPETAPPAAPADVEEPRPQPPAADRSREDGSRKPGPPESAPTDEEIERSQSMIAAVLGPEEIAKLDEEVEIEVVKPVRLRRGGWDWPGYAEALLAAAYRTPISQLARFRAANSQMTEALRVSDKEQWSRVGQALVDYERDGVIS